MMKNKTLTQFKGFLFVGVFSVFFDWSVFLALTHLLGLGAVFSKSISYIIGMAFAFFANGMLVFQIDFVPTNFIKHLLLYVLSLLVNTWVFTAMKSNFDLNSPRNLGAALFVATLVSTGINFGGMRFWVFKGKGISHAHR